MRKKRKCLTAIQEERISAFYESTALCMDSYVGIPSGWFKKESCCVFLSAKKKRQRKKECLRKNGEARAMTCRFSCDDAESGGKKHRR